jgi:DNA processing protein
MDSTTDLTTDATTDSATDDTGLVAADVRLALRLHLAPLNPADRDLAAVALARSGGDASAVALRAGGLPHAAAIAVAGVRDDAVEREIERAARDGVTLLLRGDAAYPSRLEQAPSPPFVLWVRGALPEEPTLPVAVVGPRRPTAYGVAVARRLAHDLAARGVVVVSGGARGVDRAAHEAALSAGGASIAVLGCGIDVTYPPEHGRLFDGIAEAGALVTELPFGAPPLAYHFPARNRILAGCAQAVVVTEATTRSGALITARAALAMNRDVLAVPGPITSPESEGSNALLAQGARLVASAADVLSSLGVSDRLLADTVASAPLDAAARAVLQALPPGDAITFDELVARCGLSAADTLALLSILEASGHVVRVAGGRHARA